MTEWGDVEEGPRGRRGPPPKPAFPLPRRAGPDDWKPIGEAGKYVCAECGVSNAVISDSRATERCGTCKRKTKGAPRDR